MYARQTTLGKDGYARNYKKLGRQFLPGMVLVNLSVGTREDLAAAGEFVEVSPDGLDPIAPGEQVELVAGDIRDEDLALRAARGADAIVHFAANTGVMPSVEDPRGDCMSN